MPNKYEVFVQNNGSLQRKFVAGGLAAAFGAGEFGNYAGAMKDVLLKKDLSEDDLVNKNKALDTKFEQALGLFMTKNPDEEVKKYLISLKESFISKFQEYSQNLPTTTRDLLKNAYSIDPSAVIIHFDTLDRDTLILLSCISNVVLNRKVVRSENLSPHLSKLFVGRGLFYPTLRDVIKSCYPELFSAMEGVVKKRKRIKGLFVTVCFFCINCFNCVFLYTKQ